jgi:excisionase family DNA binding protein
MPDRLLRVEQARERLQVSRAKLYEFINSGQLKSVMLGSRSRRIPESAVAEFIAARMDRRGAS